MKKNHLSNLILAALFSTVLAAPAIASASASMPVNIGSSVRAAATRGTLVAKDDDDKKDKKAEKKDKAAADKSAKKEKAPAPTGGW